MRSVLPVAMDEGKNARLITSSETRTRQKRTRFPLSPIRIYPKPAQFHIPAPEYAQNAPDFPYPNKDTPKTGPILDPNLRRRTFRGVCFCAPTRVHQKPDGFWTQTFGEEHLGAYAIRPYTGTCKTCPVSHFPNRDTPKTYPISPFPIGIRPKPTRFYT